MVGRLCLDKATYHPVGWPHSLDADVDMRSIPALKMLPARRYSDVVRNERASRKRIRERILQVDD